MYERGIVTSVEGDIVTIKCGKPGQCKACSSSFCNIKTREFRALNSSFLELKNGDEVEVYISPARTIAYSFMVLIFPLIMFIAGYYLANVFFGISSEGLRALAGLSGMAAGFILSFIFNYTQKNRNLPVVAEKL